MEISLYAFRRSTLPLKQFIIIIIIIIIIKLLEINVSRSYQQHKSTNALNFQSQLSLSLKFPKFFILSYGKVNGSRQRIFCETLLDSMIGPFLIFLPFFKKSRRPASDMNCFNDIYLRVKRTDHKSGIRYFVISAKAD